MPSVGTLLLLLTALPRAASPLRAIDPESLIFTEIPTDTGTDTHMRSVSREREATAEAIELREAAARRRRGAASATVEEVTVNAFGATRRREPEFTYPSKTPIGSIRATIKRLGALSSTDNIDEQTLRDVLLKTLPSTSVGLLKGLLFERGGRCTGCNEKKQFVQAVLDSLSQPLVARHGLPLFQYNSPLLPSTSMGLHLFEPRYKLLCRKVLKTDRYFGFVVGNVGTLAKISNHRFSDDDAVDGTCHLTVAGSRRFRLQTKWDEKCAGCTSGPLRYADVLYFNDTQPPLATPAKEAAGVSLVRDAVRLHHATISAGDQRQLEEQLGATPTTRDRGFAMSWWLSAACIATHEGCRAQADELLETRSVKERMEAVIKVLKKAVDKKHRRRGPG